MFQTCFSVNYFLSVSLIENYGMDGMDGFWKLWNVWMGFSIMWQFDYVIVYGLSYGAWWYKGKEGFLVFKKLVINYFYSFMRRNCRRGIATLSVPRSHLMQVGLYRSMSILEVNLETKWWFSWVVDPMYFSNILRLGRSEGLLGVIWKSCLSIIL